MCRSLSKTGNLSSKAALHAHALHRNAPMLPKHGSKGYISHAQGYRVCSRLERSTQQIPLHKVRPWQTACATPGTAGRIHVGMSGMRGTSQLPQMRYALQANFLHIDSLHAYARLLGCSASYCNSLLWLRPAKDPCCISHVATLQTVPKKQINASLEYAGASAWADNLTKAWAGSLAAAAECCNAGNHLPVQQPCIYIPDSCKQ